VNPSHWLEGGERRLYDWKYLLYLEETMLIDTVTFKPEALAKIRTHLPEEAL
jgi:hypothetical protein